MTVFLNVFRTARAMATLVLALLSASMPVYSADGADPTRGDLVLFPRPPEELEPPGELNTAITASASKPLDMTWSIATGNFRSGKGWWGLICDTGCRLSLMRLTVTPIRRARDNDYAAPNKRLNWKLIPASLSSGTQRGKAVMPTSQLLAVFKPVDSPSSLRFVAGPVKTWLHRGMAHYPPGGRLGTMEVAIPIEPSVNALLVPRLNRSSSDPNSKRTPAAQYHTLMLELRIGDRRQQLGIFDTRASNEEVVRPMSYLMWAGDLDGDGKLDLLIDFSGGGDRSTVALFLSTLAIDQYLVGRAGCFRSGYFQFNDPNSEEC